MSKIPGVDQVVKDLQIAWQEYQKRGVDKHGSEFGKVLFELRKNSEVVQGGTSFHSALVAAKIPPRTAYYWLERWAVENGWKKLYKKGSPAQQNIIPFEPQREMALQIIRDGFKVRKAKEPEKDRLVQAAKDWAYARLSSTELNPVLADGVVVNMGGKRFTVGGLTSSTPTTYELHLTLVEEPEPVVTPTTAVTTKLRQGTRAKKVDVGRRADGHRTDDKYCPRCHSKCVVARHEKRMATDPEYRAEFGGDKDQPAPTKADQIICC